MTSVQKRLYELQDLEYKAFSSNLCPGFDPDRMIGVRSPDVAAIAKEMKGNPEAGLFLDELPHEFFEEYAVHMCLIDGIKDFDECVRRLEAVLPYVDNWAICDHSTPKVLKKNPERLLPIAYAWIDSGKTYTVRYGIKKLMDVFLGDNFKPEYLYKVASVRSEEYYVKMMAAWFFATALALQYNEAVKIIEEGLLDKWTHNKAIQKAIESWRVSDEHKAYLRTLKIK